MAAVIKALDKELGQRGLQPEPYLVAFEEYCVGDTVFRHLLPLSPTHPQWHRGRCDRLHTHTYNTSIFMQPPPPCLPFLQDNRFWRWYIRKAVAKRNRKLMARKSSSTVTHQQQQQQRMKLWVSEFGTGGSAADLGLHVLKDLVTLKPTAWVYWQAVEDEGSPWGLMTGPISKAVAAQVAAEVLVADAPALGAGGDGAAATAAAAGSEAVAYNAEFPSINAPSLSVPGAIMLQPQYQVMKLWTSALRPGCQVFDPLAAAARLHQGGHRRQGPERRKPKLQSGVSGVAAWYADERRLVYIFGNSLSKEATVEMDLSEASRLAAGGAERHEGQQQQRQQEEEGGGVVRVVTHILKMVGLQPMPADTGQAALSSLVEKQQQDVLVGGAGGALGAAGSGGSSSSLLGVQLLMVQLPASSLVTVECTWLGAGERSVHELVVPVT